ncbi:MAG: helix-turn-helix domain-containing protein [Spirochaetota bacterium]
MALANLFYFSTYSLGRFPVLLFSLIIAIYLLLHPDRSKQSRTAGIYFLIAFFFHFGFFWAYSVYHPIGSAGYYLTALSPFAIAMLVQFAYRFPKDTKPKERRLIFWISMSLALCAFLDYCYFAYKAPIYLGTSGYGSGYVSRLVPYISIVLFVWTITIFLRKTFYHSRTFYAETQTRLQHLWQPGGKEALTCRNFSLVVLFEFINTGMMTSGMLFRSFDYVELITYMNFSFFFIYSIYVILFLRYLSGSTPISFKIINFSLLSSLILLVFAGKIQSTHSKRHFDSQRKQEIQTALSYIIQANAEQELQKISHLEFVIDWQTEERRNVLYQKTQLNFPRKFNLWQRPPGLVEFHEKQFHRSLAELKKNQYQEYYTRFANKNIQFYTVSHNDSLYSFGFHYFQYRQYMHPQILSLFSLFAYCLVTNFVFLPLILARNFSKPLQQILTDLYQKTEFLLLPSNKRSLKNEIEILEETLQQVQEDIEEKKKLQKENLLLKEKMQDKQTESEKKTDEKEMSSKNVEKIQTIKDYLQDNYQYELSREGLAAMVDLSPSRLGKYFKKETGYKINEYTNYLRIKSASELLQNSNKTVLEIAFEVGFESLRTFNRVFQEAKHTSPKKFRQDIQTTANE